MAKSTITDEEFIKIAQNAKSMFHASVLCGTNYKAFKKRAKKLNVFKPNQSGKGYNKSMPKLYSTEDILAGKYPQYQTYKLKIRLIDEGYKEDKCERCGWSEKYPGSKYSACELDHINGDSTDHRLENLILLCPNCHALTSTYRFRRGKTNEERGRNFINEIETNKNIISPFIFTNNNKHSPFIFN